MAAILALGASEFVGCDRVREAVEDIGKRTGRSWEKARRRIGTGTDPLRTAPGT